MQKRRKTWRRKREDGEERRNGKSRLRKQCKGKERRGKEKGKKLEGRKEARSTFREKRKKVGKERAIKKRRYY